MAWSSCAGKAWRAASTTFRSRAEPISVRLLPRADSEHFCVALASMLSKYLREMLMGEFNRFWLERLPGLEPTAGYPMDAMRFYAAIKPLVEQLGIKHEVVWRKR